MKQYLDLLTQISQQGVVKTDRTGTGTTSIFGPQMRFDLAQGFPLLTTKKVHLKGIIAELLWFLLGDTNNKTLTDQGVHIWDEWARPDGELGPIYGHQWVKWDDGKGGQINQIQQMVDLLKNTPDSRRMVVSAWNVADLPQMQLSPCHALFQFYTVPLTTEQRLACAQQQHQLNPLTFFGVSDELVNEGLDMLNIPKFRLDCQLYQRSADVFLGVPYNIASYALLTLMMAQVVNMVPGEFIWTGGDTHIYSNHQEQVATQLTRTPFPLPTMKLNPAVKDLFAFTLADFTLENYQCHPAIKAPVAI